VIDYGYDVGEALSRSGARREDVADAFPRDPDGLVLVPMEAHRPSDAIGGTFPSTEDGPAGLMEYPAFHEIVDRCARLETRVELEQRLWPELAFLEMRGDLLRDP
jgi:hypothetical protein